MSSQQLSDAPPLGAPIPLAQPRSNASFTSAQAGQDASQDAQVTVWHVGQVEGNLGGGEQPSVGQGLNRVEWRPPESTNQQIEPNVQGE